MNNTTPLDHARDLHARGLPPIPVPFKSKGPTLPRWQTLRLTAEDLPRHFNGTPANVGTLLGEPAGWIVDVDLDHPRAVELADTFLPHTGMMWGRESKPRSHRLFRLTRPAQTRKWSSKSCGMIVELRSTGCQTIAPGSTHPGGESVRWDDDGEPATIDPDDLTAALESLARAVRREHGDDDPEPTASPTPTPPTTPPQGTTAYGRAALKAESAKVAHARPPIGDAKGERHDTLYRAAHALGGLVASGELDEAEVVAELRAASRACGLPDHEAARAITDGLSTGKAKPRYRPAAASLSPQPARTAGAEGVSVTVTPEPIPDYRPFPVSVLPDPVGLFIAEGGKAIGCDPSFIALPMLAALAAAIGNTHRIALKRGWHESVNLWTAIVGESGTMKTPAFKLAMKATRKAQAAAFKEHAAARGEYEAAHLRYEVEVAAWKKQAGRGHGDAGDPPDKPAPPIARRFMVSDTTTEALAPILLGNPRGVMLCRDELAGWLASFDRYAKSGKGGGDSAHWLSMHNGEALTIDRKTGTPPTINVPSASVSICGGIQPGTLARALGQEHHESGMAARLLFAMPPRRVKRWTEADVDADTEAAVAAVFGRLFALEMETDPEGFGDEPEYRPRVVPLSPKGKAAWIRFYNEHAREQADLSGDLSAAWSKLEGYAARLALVVHLIRCAAGDPAVPESTTPVDEASIAAGVTLARWFGDEARRVYAILSESEGAREQRELAEWIGRKGGTLTPSELAHGLRRFRNRPEAAEGALAELVAAGVGEWVPDDHDGQGGRPTRRFRLVSAVTVTETPPNPDDSGGCGDRDTHNAPDNTGDGWGEL